MRNRMLYLRRSWLTIIGILLVGCLLFLATTNHNSIWPIRNILYYHVTNWWQERVGTSEPAGVGAVRGCVGSTSGVPIPGATVLLSEPDGTTHTTITNANGCYWLNDIPAGRYVPMVGAIGYVDKAVRSWGLPVRVDADGQHMMNVVLEQETPTELLPGTDLRIGEPVTRTWPLPQPGSAMRREISYTSEGRPNYPTFLYTPVDGTPPWPTLLAIYPGPVDGWEGVSIPLAAAGYAVIGIGPEYTFDLESDVRELQRLVAFARAGNLTGADSERIVVLAGSYSSLHVFLLLQRDVDFRGAVLLGPPTDLFEMRRQFEAGAILPPFGLDQALIALGRPHVSPERYWHNSARFHLRPDLPPLLLMHSRDDEIVPFQQSEILVAELERIGADYEAHFFDGMSHYLLATEPSDDLDLLYTLTLDFLEEVTQENN